jgi:hypothetical protein
MRRSLSDLASSRFPRTLVRPGMRRKCGMKVAEFGLGTGKPQVPAPAHEGSSGTWSSTERVFQVFGCPFCCNRGGQVIVCSLSSTIRLAVRDFITEQRRRMTPEDVLEAVESCPIHAPNVPGGRRGGEALLAEWRRAGGPVN